MNIVKYILIIISALIPDLNGIGEDRKVTLLWSSVKKWWAKRPYCYVMFYVKLIPASVAVVISVMGDRDSDKKHDDLMRSNEEQKQRISEYKEKIEAQNKLLLEQQKSIGSLVFTAPTSYAGKERFLRSFQVLARVAEIQSNGTGFTGFVCDDGVAIYWYDTETETITGFHFFANAEINRILSGNPFAASCIDKKGNVTLASDSEIAIAFKECLFRRLPSFSTNSVEVSRTRDLIIDEIKTLFRYVYRAETISLAPIYTSMGSQSGDLDLSFSYVVNPCAATWQTRSSTPLQIIISQNDLNSFHGMTMAEFSERVIRMMRTRGFEPKLDVKGIQIIAKRRQDAHATTASPFHFLGRKQ